jgi:hypothetical protein
MHYATSWKIAGNGLDTGFIDHLYTPLGTTLDRSLTHTDSCPQSITVSTSRLLAKDFNTGTVTVSLNYTLQISHTESSFHSRILATTLFFTAFHTELFSTDWVPGWQPLHTNVLVFSSQAAFQLNCPQPPWDLHYIASGWTQQKIPPQQSFYCCHWWLPSDILDIVSAGTCLPTVTKQCMFLLVIAA